MAENAELRFWATRCERGCTIGMWVPEGTVMPPDPRCPYDGTALTPHRVPVAGK